MENISYFDLPPQEIIKKVFLFLDSKDLFTIKLTCKLFKRICEENCFWNKYFLKNIFPHSYSLYLTDGNNIKQDCLALAKLTLNLKKSEETTSSPVLREIFFSCDHEIQIPNVTSNFKNFIFYAEEDAIICANLNTLKVFELADIFPDDIAECPFLFVADKSLIGQMEEGEMLIWNLDEGKGVYYLQENNCFCFGNQKTTIYARNCNLKTLRVISDQLWINTWNTLSGACVNSSCVMKFKEFEKYNQFEIGEKHLFLFDENEIVVVNMETTARTSIKENYTNHLLYNDYFVITYENTITLFNFRKNSVKPYKIILEDDPVISVHKKECYLYVFTKARTFVLNANNLRIEMYEPSLVPTNASIELSFQGPYLIYKNKNPKEPLYSFVVIHSMKGEYQQFDSSDPHLQIKNDFCMNQGCILDLQKEGEFFGKISTLSLPKTGHFWFDRGVVFQYDYAHPETHKINQQFQICYFIKNENDPEED